MKDDVELTVGQVADALGIEPRTVRGWIKPRNTKRPILEAWVPYDNRSLGYRTTVGDVRQFLDLLPRDKGHARKRFEQWVQEQDRLGQTGGITASEQ